MKKHQTIFSIKELKSRIKNAFIDGIPSQEEKIKLIENWQENIISGKVAQAKEEELKPLFLTLFFGDVLGYEYKNATEWNLRLENKSSLDSSKADAALGFFKIKDKQELEKDVRVVIEIKDARTTLDKPQNRPDFKGSPIEQCFMYAAKSGEKCKWVIVSNFLEIRLYLANDMTKYESFDILSLNDKYEFSRFYYLLANGQLFHSNIASSIDNFLANRQEREKTITKEFYEQYQYLREVFLQHLKLHNPDKNPLDLLQYAQTIIDRILFVSVIKDYDLIHYNVLKEIEDISSKSWEDDKFELWRQLGKFFKALDNGLPPRIHKFNGGLFRQNEVIETLKIKNVFLKQLLTLGNYDFESDLNVNILGHIFEQSITDIENLKREIAENKQFEYTETESEITYKSHLLETNKRKKQGIYYTPEKITYYIVSNAIGSWLEEQKEKIGLNQLIDFPNNTDERDKHIELWEKYKIALKSVKILDPSCGSGAFLTQAFDFLLQEWLIVLDVIQNLKNEKIKIKEKGLFQSMPQENAKQISKIKKEILNNNLFGVDLNHESVEITKLGLWLKSASKNDALALLDTNIKCGNSLISDKEVSEKAFDWNEGFARLFSPEKYYVETEKKKKEEIIVRKKELIELEEYRKNKPFYVKLDDVDNWINVKKTIIRDLEYELELLYEWKKTNPQPIEGFDIIIGNPPYIRPHNIADNEKVYLWRTFKVAEQKTDIYAFFIEKSIKLLKENGINSFIVPKTWMNTFSFKHLRKFIIENTEPQFFTLLPKKVFEDATVETIIFQIIKKKSNSENNYLINDILDNKINISIPLSLISSPNFNFSTFENPLVEKLEQYPNKIKDHFTVKVGIVTGNDEKFIIKSHNSKIDKPYLKGADINRYGIEWSGNYIHYDREEIIADGNLKPKSSLKLAIGQSSPKKPEDFEQPKVLLRNLGSQLCATYDNLNYYVNVNVVLIQQKSNIYDLKFLTALLNSELINSYIKSKVSNISFNTNIIKEIPLPDDAINKDEVIQLVDKVLAKTVELYKQKNSFIEIVKSQLKVGKISKKLDNWYDTDWNEFSEELEKLKVKLDLKKIKEWNEFFNSEQKNVKPITTEIKNITQAIDKKIYEIYEISTAEINEINKNSYNI